MPFPLSAMVIDYTVVREVATAIFMAGSYVFMHKAHTSDKRAQGAADTLNGHADTVEQLRRRVNWQAKRITQLRADSEEYAVELQNLRDRVHALESRSP